MQSLQKWYTRIIGLFFITIIISFGIEFFTLGHTAELWHKAFHVILGSIIVWKGWNNKGFWRPFCLINGAFFIFVAAFGWTFPDFAGLEAFNRLDSILHTIVGISGLVIGLKK